MHNFPLHCVLLDASASLHHDDIMEWKHFPRYWPFVREIHRSPVNSPHRCRWREALMYSLVRTWAGGWIHTRDGSDSRRHRVHYDVTVVMMRLSTALVLCAVNLLQRSHRGVPHGLPIRVMYVVPLWDARVNKVLAFLLCVVFNTMSYPTAMKLRMYSIWFKAFLSSCQWCLFRIADPMCRESAGHQWLPSQGIRIVGTLIFLTYLLRKSVEQTVESLVIINNWRIVRYVS